MFKKLNVIIITIVFSICFFGWVIPINQSIIYAQEITNNQSSSKIYSGFKLLNKEFLEGVDSTVYEYEHIKNGAKLVYIQNKDTNRKFNITFKTLPQNNTGVYHIIEHIIATQCNCVQAGTDNDLTEYKFSGSSENELNEKIDRCLNTIFLPDYNTFKMLFKQQGWHYEINNINDELKINGIVYNEIKGNVLPDSKITYLIKKSIYPNICYSYDCGGVLEDIPKLTYENLLKTFKKDYTPSNCFIYLYGDMDIEKMLKNIDSNYFNKFNKNSMNVIQKDKTNIIKFLKGSYSISSNDNEENKTYIALNYKMCKNTDYETKLGLKILDNILIPSISNTLSDNGFQSIYTYNPKTIDIIKSLFVTNVNESDKDKLINIVNNKLKSIVANGIDSKSLKAALNKYELKEREKSISSYRSNDFDYKLKYAWLYNGNIIDCLKTNETINSIKQKSKDNYFEDLIRKYYLNNDKKSVVVMTPKQGLNDKNIEELNNTMKEYKKSLTKAQLEQLIKENQQLQDWVVDFSNNLKPIKKEVKIDKRSRMLDFISLNTKDIEGIKVLEHLLSTNGIQYINLYYDTSKVPQDKLMYLILLTKLLTNISTENYDVNTLDKAINTYTGGITVNSCCKLNSKNDNEIYPKVHVSYEILENNIKDSFKLINEIFHNTKFTNKEEIKTCIKQLKQSITTKISYDLDWYLINEVSSDNSLYEKYNNMRFIPFYRFICDLNKDIDNNIDTIITNLEEVASLAFDKENLIVSCTGGKSGFNKFESCIKDYAKNIKCINAPRQKYSFELVNEDKAYVTPFNFQCVAKNISYNKYGYKNSGELAILNRLLNEYVFEEVRKKGGAYGAYVNINPSSIIFHSYVDPKLKETINRYNEVSDFIRNIDIEQDELTQHIVKVLNVIDQPYEASYQGIYCDSLYIENQTTEDLIKYRKEVISTTVQDLRNYAEMFDDIMKHGNICVFGNENKIKGEKDLFDSIEDLFEY